MNIDRLKYFAAVVETKNLRKAADLVGITPGSMSKAISVLKDELGVELIRPEGRGIAITPDGYRVYRASAPLFDAFRSFSENLTRKVIKESNAKIRVGTFEVFSSYFLSALLEKEFPEREALAIELAPGHLEEAVESGLVQYGFTYLPSPNSKLEFVEVGSFKMGVYGLKKWEKIAFKDWPFAIPITQLKINALNHTSLDMWPQLKPRTIKYEFELLETALQTSRLGLSVIHCPDFIINLHNRSVVAVHRLVPLSQSTKKIKILLVVKKEIQNTNSIEGKVAKFLRSLVL